MFTLIGFVFLLLIRPLFCFRTTIPQRHVHSDRFRVPPSHPPGHLCYPPQAEKRGAGAGLVLTMAGQSEAADDVENIACLELGEGGFWGPRPCRGTAPFLAPQSHCKPVLIGSSPCDRKSF
uniref:Secreted protein n=1 Tax=Cacopsylla melanoneura TaxID=428564 RepID=A0A8D8X3K7_9HEMI